MDISQFSASENPSSSTSANSVVGDELPYPGWLDDTPSKGHGISPSTEHHHRVFGCEMIQEAVLLMKLPQVIAASGQTMFHRFYQRASFKRFDAFTVAMGCILLAGKVEEHPMPLREILFAFHQIYQRRKGLRSTPLDIASNRYSEWKAELAAIELFILKELGFSLYTITDHPHKYILYYIRILNGSKELSQKSWNYLNDSLRLNLSLRYDSQEIACAAIYISARLLEFPLPTSPHWWKLMTQDFDRVCEIAEAILSLYDLPKLSWLEPIVADSYLAAEKNATIDIPLPTVTKPKAADIYNIQQKASRFDCPPTQGNGATASASTADNYHSSRRSRSRSSSSRHDDRQKLQKNRDTSRESDNYRGDRDRNRDNRDRETDSRKDSRDKDRFRRRDSRDRDRDRDRDRRRDSRDRNQGRNRDREEKLNSRNRSDSEDNSNRRHRSRSRDRGKR